MRPLPPLMSNPPEACPCFQLHTCFHWGRKTLKPPTAPRENKHTLHAVESGRTCATCANIRSYESFTPHETGREAMQHYAKKFCTKPTPVVSTPAAQSRRVGSEPQPWPTSRAKCILTVSSSTEARITAVPDGRHTTTSMQAARDNDKSLHTYNPTQRRAAQHRTTAVSTLASHNRSMVVGSRDQL